MSRRSPRFTHRLWTVQSPRFDSREKPFRCRVGGLGPRLPPGAAGCRAILRGDRRPLSRRHRSTPCSTTRRGRGSGSPGTRSSPPTCSGSALGQKGFQRLLPLFPRAVERLPLGDHDVVLSSSSAFAHGVRPGGDAVHVCYCHTPFRYAWYAREAGLAQAPRPLRRLVDRSLNRIQRWDRGIAQRPTHYIANSRITQERLRRYWGREADVVHPPVELDRFAPGRAGGLLPRRRRAGPPQADRRRAGGGAAGRCPDQGGGDGSARGRAAGSLRRQRRVPRPRRRRASWPRSMPAPGRW